jgi:hypothetical protein
MDTQGGGSEHKTAHPGPILPSNIATFSAKPRPRADDEPGVQHEHVDDDGRASRSGELASGRMVSARRAIALMVLVMAAVAVLVPLPLHRPAWIEAEAVLGVWWAIWAVVLAWMLYVGVGLRDDLATGAEDGEGWWYHLHRLDLSWFAQADWLGVETGGVWMAILVLLLLGVFMLIGVLLVDVVLPLLVPLGYAVVLWMLRRVVQHDQHHHEGRSRNLARSLGLGVWWASVYSAPLALAVVLVHVLF